MKGKGLKGQALKGHLDLLLLAVLAEEPLHGYAVIVRLRQVSGQEFDLPEGTVYPALHRLDRAGMVTSTWVEVESRRRRVYRLTAKGRRALGEQADAWAAFSAAMTVVLRGVRWAPT